MSKRPPVHQAARLPRVTLNYTALGVRQRSDFAQIRCYLLDPLIKAFEDHRISLLRSAVDLWTELYVRCVVDNL